MSYKDNILELLTCVSVSPICVCTSSLSTLPSTPPNTFQGKHYKYRYMSSGPRSNHNFLWGGGGGAVGTNLVVHMGRLHAKYMPHPFSYRPPLLLWMLAIEHTLFPDLKSWGRENHIKVIGGRGWKVSHCAFYLRQLQ